MSDRDEMNKTEINDLLREWRNSVISRLDQLSDGQSKLADKISLIERSFASEARLEKIIEEQHSINNVLQTRIQKLENFYFKLIGASIVIQIVFSLYVTFFLHPGK